MRKFRDKIIRGGIALTISNIYSQLLSLVVNIVLALLLIPEAFGIIALATTFIGMVSIFTTIGFGSSILYNSEINETKLSTIFWVNFALCIISFLIIFLLAPSSGNYYESPELPSVVQWTSINILISPLFTIQYKLLERELKFAILSRINIISSTIGALFGIFAAYLDLGVYALVLQLLLSTLTKLFLIEKNIYWRPRLVFDFHSVKDMVWYSIRFQVANNILYIERNVDYLVLGKFFSAAILGYYAFAYNVMYMPVKRISYIFNDVLFPSFSSLRGDQEKIMKGYFESIKIIAVIAFPLMTLVSINAHFLLNSFFGGKWDGAVEIIRVLSYAGAIQSVSQVGGVVFSSIGKPEVNIYTSIFRTFLVVMAIIIGAYFSILAVTVFLLIAKLLAFLGTMLIMRKLLRFEWFQLANALKNAFFVMILLISVDYILDKFLRINDFGLFLVTLCLAIGSTIFLNINQFREVFCKLFPSSKVRNGTQS